VDKVDELSQLLRSSPPNFKHQNFPPTFLRLLFLVCLEETKYRDLILLYLLFVLLVALFELFILLVVLFELYTIYGIPYTIRGTLWTLYTIGGTLWTLYTTLS